LVSAKRPSHRLVVAILADLAPGILAEIDRPFETWNIAVTERGSVIGLRDRKNEQLAMTVSSGTRFMRSNALLCRQ